MSARIVVAALTLVCAAAGADAAPGVCDAGTWTFSDRVLDRSRALDATTRGVRPDDKGDQSAALAAVVAEVARRADVDTVYLPAGRYRIATHWAPVAGVHLVGDGAGRTILERGNADGYLLFGKRVDGGDGTVIAHLTLDNARRTVMLQLSRRLAFHGVEFRVGIVRFERCSDIVIDGCVFNDNLGKAGYASSECENIRITRSRFRSVEHGSINLSGHRNSYVAHNTILAERLIDSGYAGIRLPNGARDNVVEHNVIENHGRGLFVLSGATGNTVRFNTVRATTYQGVFVQSPGNIIDRNTIIDAGDEAIYVAHGHSPALPFPSPGERNQITGNTITDTRAFDAERFVGLRIYGNDNVVTGNTVSSGHGRRFLEVTPGAGNRAAENRYVDAVVPATD